MSKEIYFENYVQLKDFLALKVITKKMYIHPLSLKIVDNKKESIANMNISNSVVVSFKS